MTRKRMVPSVTLKGASIPFSRFAEFAPQKVQTRVDPGTGATVPDSNPVLLRSSSPAALEAARVLASRSRAVVRTARPVEHPIIPWRGVG